MAGKPLVGITMGDPAGIGAEVIAKALAEGGVHDSCRPFVIGNTAAMEAAVRVIGGGTAVRGIAEAGDAAGDAGAIDVLDLENLAYGEVETGQISTEAGRGVGGVGAEGWGAGEGRGDRGDRDSAYQQRGGATSGVRGRWAHGDLSEPDGRVERGDDAYGGPAARGAPDDAPVAAASVRLRDDG